MPHRPIEVDIEGPTIVDVEGMKISSYEAKELVFLWGAQPSQDIAAVLDTLGSFMGFIPTVEGAVKP